MMFTVQQAMARSLAGTALAMLLAPVGVGAEDRESVTADPAGVTLFEAKIRPVLAKHCLSCHSEADGAVEGGLSLDSRPGLLAGGQRGPAVVPGEPEESWLLKAIQHSEDDLQMPPKQPRLSAAVIADFRQWIRRGAVDPRDSAEAASGDAGPRADENFWSLQPPQPAGEVVVSDHRWPRSQIDRFVLAALEQQGIGPSPAAEPAVLLRRLHFDLVGLPPAPEVLQRFLDEVDATGFDTAWARQVDRLLASPAFAEHWGRRWLDVARFGESSGGEANITFPHAWRYRDYVIDCFDADMPLDRFLTEQIAGDLLPADSAAERSRLLVATGLLAVGPKRLDEGNLFQFLADTIDEQIDSLSRGLLGKSIACARCHDHKFDPYSMQDYYSLAGIFLSTKTHFGTAVSPANRRAGDPLVLPRLDDQLIFHDSMPRRRVERLESELAELNEERRRGRAAVRRAIAEGRDPSGLFPLRDSLRIFWRTGAIEGQLKNVDDSGRALPLAMGTLDRDDPQDAPLLHRGEIESPGSPLPRGFPAVFPHADRYPIGADESGRLQLAQWLTDPSHPLTTRVWVNRIWHHLFGAGLVSTVDNFGATGQRPSHPELLDELALGFIRDGWSTKRLVRRLVLSRTYRQGSAHDEAKFRIDPENRLLWRMPKRRLPAEAIRDAVLAVSGEMDAARPAGSLVARVIGDRPVSLVGLNRRVPADLDPAPYRSLYLPIMRDRLPEALELFDFADPGMVTGQRESTNVPLQSLYLMNSRRVTSSAAAMAGRLRRQAAEVDQRIELAYQYCFARRPSEAERARCRDYLRHTGQGDPDAADAWQQFAQALLATAEFRNLD